MLIKALYVSDKINVMQYKGVVNFQKQARIIDEEYCSNLDVGAGGGVDDDGCEEYYSNGYVGNNDKNRTLNNKKYITYSD